MFYDSMQTDKDTHAITNKNQCLAETEGKKLPWSIKLSFFHTITMQTQIKRLPFIYFFLFVLYLKYLNFVLPCFLKYRNLLSESFAVEMYKASLSSFNTKMSYITSCKIIFPYYKNWYYRPAGNSNSYRISYQVNSHHFYHLVRVP